MVRDGSAAGVHGARRWLAWAVGAGLGVGVLAVAACGKREPERVEKPPVQAPVGEQRRVRHILVLYRGAQGAGPEITRSKAAADSLLQSLRHRVERGESFAELARQFSDDPS